MARQEEADQTLEPLGAQGRNPSLAPPVPQKDQTVTENYEWGEGTWWVPGIQGKLETRQSSRPPHLFPPAGALLVMLSGARLQANAGVKEVLRPLTFPQKEGGP